MPESLDKHEIDNCQDPSVTKQWDDDVSLDKKMEDFGAIADKLKIGIMGTLRDGIGVSPPLIVTN
jgi:hypothetical protein